MPYLTRRIPRSVGSSIAVVRCNCGQEVHCEEARGNDCLGCGTEYDLNGQVVRRRALSGDDLVELGF